MRIRKIKYMVLLISVISLTIIPFTFAISSEIGTDPNNDILQSNSSNLIALEYWLGNFYFNENDPPYATDLFNNHSELFIIVDGPDCVDVEKWGIDGDDLYIVVEDIDDYIDYKYFSIGILMIYNSIVYREFIVWYGQIDIYNGVVENDWYISILNEDEHDEANETGHVGVNIESNTYILKFDDSWITETETEVIANEMYGVVFGVSVNGSFFGNISQYNIDMIPNNYYGQVDVYIYHRSIF